MVAAMWFAACGGAKGTNSNAPKLELVQQQEVYSNNLQYDSLIFFQLFYEDEDGDIGLGDADTSGEFAFGAPYFYTFFCHLYALKNDTWIEVPNPFDPTQRIQFHERFPNLTPTGTDKRLSGELELFIPARPNGVELDTIRFEMQLFDRALHKSNICYSKEFILKHP
jgi:hypothetical protein